MRNWDEEKASAICLFDDGFGERAVARRLGIEHDRVRKWFYTYRAFGKEALFVSEHKKYGYELKLAAAKALVDEGLTRVEVMQKYGIRSVSALKSWCAAYRKGDLESLKPRPKGRPRKPAHPAYSSREEELEARVRELELELEIQKRINALADEIERESHRR